LYTRQHVRTDSSEKLAGEKQTVGENFPLTVNGEI